MPKARKALSLLLCLGALTLTAFAAVEDSRQSCSGVVNANLKL